MSINGSVWTPIGPSPITESGRQDNGMTTAIAVNPNDGDVVYQGTAGGGVWKTRDGGTTWRPLFGQQHALGIGEPAGIAIDPRSGSPVCSSPSTAAPAGSSWDPAIRLESAATQASSPHRTSIRSSSIRPIHKSCTWPPTTACIAPPTAAGTGYEGLVAPATHARWSSIPHRRRIGSSRRTSSAPRASRPR